MWPPKDASGGSIFRIIERVSALAACTFRPQRVFGMRVFGMHMVMIVVMMMPMTVTVMVIVAVTMFVVMVVVVIMTVAVVVTVVMSHIQATLPSAEKITEFTVRHV